MTTVLIIDPDERSRLVLEAQLAQSNQFERVLSCKNLTDASCILQQHEIKVLLVDEAQASRGAELQKIKADHPELGVVLLQGGASSLDTLHLQALGAHAQTSRMASSMEIMASVAKALVARLAIGKRILRK